MSAPERSRGGAALAQAVRELYQAGQSDYALEPLVACAGDGSPLGRVQDGDAVIFCCRRGEREVELTEAFTQADFPHFPTAGFQNLAFVILTLYHEKFKDLRVAFLPALITDTLAETASRAGLRQLHTSESEKFAHVTFFLNGGNHQPFPGEVDLGFPSPRGVAMDQVPELSLAQVAQGVNQALAEGYDLIIANFANGDVIGHTANNQAKIRCAEIVDTHLGQVAQAALAAGYVVLVTADHGNLEEMTQPDGSPHVAHTTNLVPLILIDPRASQPVKLCGGSLADVAPTVLSALGIEAPELMTGANLAPGHAWGGPRRVLLIILDGWGVGREDESNPIFVGQTPVWDELTRQYPPALLHASGEAVGLQAGKAGNSEAGHMNIGAGRVVLQDDVRLDLAMKDGSFTTNPVFLQTIEEVKQRGSSLHLFGLLTEKSSHGSIDYPLALLKMAKAHGLERVFVHIIFDGRSTQPGSAPELLEKLDRLMAEIGVGQIVTGVGRALALDRDQNYAKIKRAYDALVFGAGKHYRAGEGVDGYEA